MGEERSLGALHLISWDSGMGEWMGEVLPMYLATGGNISKCHHIDEVVFLIKKILDIEGCLPPWKWE